MKVLWFTNILMPEFARELGISAANQGGWMPSLIDAIREFARAVNLYVASEGPVETCLQVNGVSYISLGTMKGSRRFMPWARGLRKDFVSAVCRCVDNVNPNIVHFHGSEGVIPSIVTSRSNGVGVPSVISLQGIIAGCYPHYFGDLTERELRPCRNLVREIFQGYSTASEAEYWRMKRSKRELQSIRKVNYILGRTSWDKAWAKYINPDVEYLSVGEVMRPEFYGGMRKESEIVRHTIYCGASAAYPLKGAHWLLRAVAALKAKYPDIKLIIANAKAVERPASFIGRLRQGEYHRYLCQLISDLDIWPNVQLCGSLSATEVAQTLRRAEVFCLPSLIENSPNSLAEAMLMGVPAIATDVGGVKSMLQDGVEGLLVPSGDPAVLADAIDCYFSNRYRAQGYANKAFVTAVARHAPEKIVKQLINAYCYMLEGEKSTSGH